MILETLGNCWLVEGQLVVFPENKYSANEVGAFKKKF